MLFKNVPKTNPFSETLNEIIKDLTRIAEAGAIEIEAERFKESKWLASGQNITRERIARHINALLGSGSGVIKTEEIAVRVNSTHTYVNDAICSFGCYQLTIFPKSKEQTEIRTGNSRAGDAKPHLSMVVLKLVIKPTAAQPAT